MPITYSTGFLLFVSVFGFLFVSVNKPLQAFGCSVEKLHLFFRCAVTNYRKLGGFKQQTFIFWLFWRPEVRINISAGVSSGYKLESRCKPSCKGFRGESISCLFQLLYLWCIIPISVSFFLTASSSSLRCQTFFCFTVRDTWNWI